MMLLLSKGSSIKTIRRKSSEIFVNLYGLSLVISMPVKMMNNLDKGNGSALQLRSQVTGKVYVSKLC